MFSILEKKHAILVTEFDRYVMEHPEFASNIPRNAQIVLQFDESASGQIGLDNVAFGH